ncbi:unnamed protein product, partial [Symbiodinium sp. CCMP2592]
MVTISAVPTMMNPSDIGTKALGAGRLRLLLNLLGFRDGRDAIGTTEREEAERSLVLRRVAARTNSAVARTFATLAVSMFCPVSDGLKQEGVDSEFSVQRAHVHAAQPQNSLESSRNARFSLFVAAMDGAGAGTPAGTENSGGSVLGEQQDLRGLAEALQQDDSFDAAARKLAEATKREEVTKAKEKEAKKREEDEIAAKGLMMLVGQTDDLLEKITALQKLVAQREISLGEAKAERDYANSKMIDANKRAETMRDEWKQAEQKLQDVLNQKEYLDSLIAKEAESKEAAKKLKQENEEKFQRTADQRAEDMRNAMIRSRREEEARQNEDGRDPAASGSSDPQPQPQQQQGKEQPEQQKGKGKQPPPQPKGRKGEEQQPKGKGEEQQQKEKESSSR